MEQGKSANRYLVVQFLKSITETIVSEAEYKKFIELFNAENRDEKNPYVYGRLETIHLSNSPSWIVKYSVYRKVTKKSSLETVEKFITDRFEDEAGLKQHFSKDVEGTGKMYIGYMLSGQIRTIPIFYKKDAVYTRYEDLTNLMVENYNNEKFLANVWSNAKFNAPEYRKKVEFYLEKLQIAYGKYIMSVADEKILAEEVKSSIRDFMRAWCISDSKINQRKVREAGSIVKNCLEKDKKLDEKMAETLKRKRKKTNPEEEIRLF